MKVKVIRSGGYIDRHGKKYDQNAVCEMSDELATKLARLRMVEIVGGASRKITTVTTAALAPPENAAAEPPAPRRGRPPKAAPAEPEAFSSKED